MPIPFPSIFLLSSKAYHLKIKTTVVTTAKILHTKHRSKYEVNARFNIVFEEDVKFLKSICVFRLEFDLLKNYDIFLSAKLLRKIKNYS